MTNDTRMLRGKTERETAGLNGWGVGTRLVGDEGYGPTEIVITYFTRDGRMLAAAVSRGGKPTAEIENFWTLDCRDWREVSS